jgi:hypothetical protein
MTKAIQRTVKPALPVPLNVGQPKVVFAATVTDQPEAAPPEAVTVLNELVAVCVAAVVPLVEKI